MNQFTQPISQTANIANILQATAAAAERVFGFLDADEEKLETAKDGIKPESVKGEVEFDKVYLDITKVSRLLKTLRFKLNLNKTWRLLAQPEPGKPRLLTC